MKRFVRWYYGLSAALAAAAVLGALATAWVVKTEPAVAQSFNISGWAWSGTAGWISLSSSNCGKLNQSMPNSCTPGAQYGLNLALANASSGNITGYAWSEDAGWICFGSTCGGDPPGADTSPDINFVCKDLDGVTSIDCDSLSWKKCAGSNKMCNADDDCATGDSCSVNIGTAPSVKLSGWAKVYAQGDQGWIRLRSDATPDGTGWTWSKLYFERGRCSADPVQLNAAGAVCNSNNDCMVAPNTNCVFDSNRGAGLGGWAYQFAGGDIGNPYGMSWVSLDEDAPEVLFPYLSAEGGDVFSRSVRAAFPPPSGKYNASYLVHVRGSSTGDLSARFRSKCLDLQACRNRSYELELPQDPTSDAGYTFRLGRFDFQGLMGPTNTSSQNTYGHQVVRLSNESQDLPGTSGSARSNDPLAGRVYVVSPTDLTYDLLQPIVFKNSSNISVSGAGTVIVRGNLHVTQNISYESNTVGDERGRLASVVWIVLGDVTVDPSVSKLAGTFIILGRRGNMTLNGVCTGGLQSMKACSADGDCGLGGSCVTNGLCVALGSTCTTSCTAPGQCIPPPSGTGSNVCVTATTTACGIPSAACDTGQACRTKCLLKDANGNLQPDCGRFVSGAGSASSLTVSGSVFAREFSLQRTYVDPVNRDPAERFTADGRLQLNPPPGMADFAKGLPTFRRQ